ncbi:MAG TPA: 5-(carboxyamino)imidazole ribonucleotide mutase [Pyrinomonadaceae bacterium]|nr:5-(carboxyamino)imidazole ribonucleotide mutase [Pyrinomonadaceae bacterium]
MATRIRKSNRTKSAAKRSVSSSPRLPVSPSPHRRVSASHGGAAPLVAVIMGSKSDWETMRYTDEVLTRFGVAHECRVISAHRTPELASAFASNAQARGTEVIIAAAGGAAHLAGVIAAHTTLPVLGVPMKSDALNGMDSLLSTVQMPAGVPVGTLAIGKPGATNAALFAVAILANSRPELREKLRQFRKDQEKQVREAVLE